MPKLLFLILFSLFLVFPSLTQAADKPCTETRIGVCEDGNKPSATFFCTEKGTPYTAPLKPIWVCDDPNTCASAQADGCTCGAKAAGNCKEFAFGTPGGAAAVPPAAPAAAAAPKLLGWSGGITCVTSTGETPKPGTATNATARTIGSPANGWDGIMTAIGCIPTKPKELVEGIIKYGALASGGIAFLIMILAALQMITAEGNPENIKHAQEKFYSAIIGLLLIVFSVLLMQVIGVDILGLNAFGK